MCSSIWSLTLLLSNLHVTVREIAKRLNVSHTTIENHIICLGLERNSLKTTYVKRNAINPLLKLFITGDEK